MFEINLEKMKFESSSKSWKVRGVIWNAPKSMWNRNLSCDGKCIFCRNAPKSKMFIFGSFSVFRIKWEKFNWSRAFFSKCPTFLYSFFLKCPIFPFWFWKQKMNRKWTSSILGHFEKKCICYHMIKSSYTYFLGHFKLPPVKP